ncbi:MAG: hypothetical protein NZ532_04200 [Thermoflexales bacterium]|nr:hypothetical protein [Thermoflexales bacterium]
MDEPQEAGKAAEAAPATPSAQEPSVLERIHEQRQRPSSNQSAPRTPPPTTILLPRTRAGWAKLFAVGGGLAALLIALAFGLRLLSTSNCQEFTLFNDTVAARGVKITVRPEDMIGGFGVRLEFSPASWTRSPRDDFERAALEALSPMFLPQGELVRVTRCGTPPRRVTVRLALPSSAEQTLDLYGWFHSERTWRWLSAQVEPATREVLASLTQLPDALALVHVQGNAQALSIELPLNGNTQSLTLLHTERVLPAFYLIEQGRVMRRESAKLPESAEEASKTTLAVRNWGMRGEFNRTLLREAILDTTARESHRIILANLIANTPYSALEVDYRGVDDELGDAFSDLIEQLAARLRQRQKRLHVVIPPPLEETDKPCKVRGYDVPRLVASADRIKIDLSAEPAALASQRIEQVLSWARRCIDPAKLQVALPATSLEQDVNGRARLLDLQEALTRFGTLQPLQPSVRPGDVLLLRWEGRRATTAQPSEGDLPIASYLDERGVQRTVWLITSAEFKRILAQIQRVPMHSLVLRGFLDPKPSEEVVKLVEAFSRGEAVDNIPTREPQFRAVLDSGEQFIASPSAETVRIWAPQTPGEYRVQTVFASEREIVLGTRAFTVSTDAPPVDPLMLIDDANGVQSDTPAVTLELGGYVQDLRLIPRMRSAGMSWVATEVKDFEQPESFIREAKARGMKVLVRAYGDPKRLREEGYRAAWTAHLAQLAQLGVDAIEVWREPNHASRWIAGQINGAEYTALLRQAYAAIKAANPQTLVISAGLAQTGGLFLGGCESEGCEEFAFLSQMSAAGAAEAMDCLGVQYTNGADAPDVVGAYHYSWYFQPVLSLYAGAFNNRVPVCFVALGYLAGKSVPRLPQAFSFAANTSLADQAEWLGKAVALAKQSGKVRLAIIWNVDGANFPATDEDPRAGYAMIRPDDTCPACDAVRSAMESQPR